MAVTQTVPGLSEIIQRIGGIVPGSGYSLDSIKAYTSGWGLITHMPISVSRSEKTVTAIYHENIGSGVVKGSFMYFQVVSSEDTALTQFSTDFSYVTFEGLCHYQMSIAFVRGT